MLLGLIAGVGLCLPLIVLNKAADQVARVKVTNHSGMDIVSMLIRESGDDDHPATDVLAGPNSLRSGVQASFEHKGYTCARTLDVEFADGHKEQRVMSTACSGVVLEFGQRGADAEANPSFLIGNSISPAMTSFMVSRVNAPEWSSDRLGAPLLQGQSRAIYLPRGECLYDLKASFADGQVVEKRGVDVCATASLQVP